MENNFLSQSEYAELDRLMNKKVLTPEDAMKVQYLLEKDKVSGRLLYIWKTKPETLSQEGQALLFKWVDEYGNIPQQMQLLNAPANVSEMKPDYSDLKLRAQRIYNYSGSFEGRAREYLATGLSVVGTGGNGLVIKGDQYVGNAAKGISTTVKTTASTIGAFTSKYPKTTEGIVVGSVSTGYDLYNGYATLEGTAMNYVLGWGLAGKSWDQQLSVNAIYKAITAVNENKSNEEIISQQLSSAASVTSGEAINKLLDIGDVKGSSKQIISNLASGYIENQTKKIDEEKK